MYLYLIASKALKNLISFQDVK